MQPTLYRIWWMTRVPATDEQTFHLPVSSPTEGMKVYSALAQYDLFLEKNGFIGNFANTGGMEVSTDGGATWEEWTDDDGCTIEELS